MRAHTGLKGPLAEGNAQAEAATRLAFLTLDPSVSEAHQAHALHHLNALTLRQMFKITREQAREIVKSCNSCAQFSPVPHLGVNPRGLIPNDRWQMDVTHFPSFGRLKYIHATVDTYSGFIYATALTGEASKDVITHTLQSMSVMGKPNSIKTDNGPGYTGAKFRQFYSQLKVKHITGIPYNPQGQGIIERTHQTLKNMLKKLELSTDLSMTPTPRNRLNHALFIINFLTLDNNNQSAADRHWHPTTQDSHALAMWKDPLTGAWKGPDPVLIWGGGSACVYDRENAESRWLPEWLLRAVNSPLSRKEANPLSETSSSPSFPDAANSTNMIDGDPLQPLGLVDSEPMDTDDCYWPRTTTP